jgi:hypothetical protein
MMHRFQGGGSGYSGARREPNQPERLSNPTESERRGGIWRRIN